MMMRFMKKLVFVVMMVFILAAPIKVLANETRRGELWSAFGLRKHMYDDYYFYLARELRFGNDYHNVNYRFTEGGFSFEKFDWVHLGMYYRYGTRKKDGLWEQESRPHFNITLRKRIDRFVLSTRNRIEYQMVRKTRDSWRYRNKLMISMPTKWFSKNVEPYIADEFFIDFDQTHALNRLSGGIWVEIVEHLIADVYYLWQSRVDRWQSHAPDHVIGVGFLFEF